MIPGSDPWLERWLPLLAERCTDAPILELGCGSGQDSATLAAAGHSVVGVDLSERSIAGAKARVPAAKFHCQDLRAPFPLPPGAAVERMFADGWRMIGLEEMTVHRYAHPKSLWEAVLEPIA